MKNLPEPTRAVDNLPAFLDSHSDADTTGGTRADEAVHEATDEPVPADGEGGGDAAAAASEVPAAASADAADPDAPPSPARRRREEPGTTSAKRTGGTLATMLGILALLGSPVAAFAPALATYGVTPNLTFVLGALLVAAGMTQRHVGRLQQRLEEAESNRREDASAVRANLQQLVDDTQREKAPAQGEELQHVLLSLQRQDEKVNNLTKAIKMYGKPLMEIAGQSTELAGALPTIKALVEGGTESARQGINRLEAQLRAATTSKDLTEMNASLQRLAQRVEAIANTSQTVSLEPLQQQLGRLEIAVGAVAQRLEDSEVRKSLLRLEDATQKGREAVQELLRGDSVRQATAQLQSRVEAATKGLADGLTQLRDGNLGGLENSVREIQREVATVATTVAQINAAVKGGVRLAANAPAPAPAPVPETSAVAATAGAAPAPTAKAATTPPAAAEATSGYQTGTRTSGGKNVLGAIAKLKQMKS